MAVATPEGVTLEFTLAGLGSRFTAALLDWLIMIGLLIASGLVSWGLSGVIGEWADAFSIIAFFVVLFGYHIAFETWGSGRSPGKRANGLRVVKVGGAPVTFFTSAIRNLLIFIDFLPFGFLAGMVSIVATKKNQRIGDLAAGTIVVRERKAAPAPTPSWAGWTPPTAPGGWAPAPTGHGQWGAPPQGQWGAPPAGPTGPVWVGGQDVSTWDVSAVTAEEIAAIRQFLARRNSITSEARYRLAMDMATRLRPKVASPQGTMAVEHFLEAIVAAKSIRG